MNSVQTLPASDLAHILVYTRPLWSAVRGARFFITGGTGFIGRWLVESLLHADHQLNLGIEVTILSRNPNSQLPAPCSLLVGSIADFPFPPGRFDYIIHAAGDTSPDADILSMSAGNHRVLQLATQAHARRLLYLSSGAAVHRCDTSYGQGKIHGERLCRAVAEFRGFGCQIARGYAFIGPGLPAKYAAAQFIRQALAGGPIRVTGGGTVVRSYLYAADLAIWLWTILLRGRSGVPYDVGSPHAITLLDLARLIGHEAGVPVEVESPSSQLPAPSFQRYIPSLLPAHDELGLRPLVTLSDSIRRTLAWSA